MDVNIAKPRRCGQMATPNPYNGQGLDCLDPEKVSAHPLLLSKPEKVGVVPHNDLKVLAKTIGVENQGNDGPEVSTPPVTPTTVGQRSVLDNMKYGHRNRPYWEMKEGRVQSRHPDLIGTLKRDPDPSHK